MSVTVMGSGDWGSHVVCTIIRYWYPSSDEYRSMYPEVVGMLYRERRSRSNALIQDTPSMSNAEAHKLSRWRVDE